MFVLLSLLACDTCPPPQTCQGPCSGAVPVAKGPGGATDLASAEAFNQTEFWAAAPTGLGPTTGGATENHDGMYGVVGRRSDNNFSATGFLIARDGVAGPPTAIIPSGGNEETFCASRAFSWPQFLAGGNNPPYVSWTVLPIADTEPLQGKCNGMPVRLEGAFNPVSPFDEYPLDTSPTKAGVKRFYVKSCTAGATCPAAVDGVPAVSGARATTLLPGVYALASVGITVPTIPGPDVMVAGTGTLYVRPASDTTKPWTVETYCYDANFRWPRVQSPFVPGGVLGTFQDASFTVTPKTAAGAPMTAPAAPTCAAGLSRADYCFTTDPTKPCTP